MGSKLIPSVAIRHLQSPMHLWCRGATRCLRRECKVLAEAAAGVRSSESTGAHSMPRYRKFIRCKDLKQAYRKRFFQKLQKTKEARIDIIYIIDIYNNMY